MGHMSLETLHGYRDSVRWRLTTSGVEIEGSGVERTFGEPQTVSRAWDLFSAEVNRSADSHKVPCALIIATICIESDKGDPRAVHLRPGYVSDDKTPEKVCVGLMQTLLSTARTTLRKPVDRDWLMHPENSIMTGTALIRQQSEETSLDPPLVAAAYAAGSLRHRPSEHNRWKLRFGPFYSGEYGNRFIRLFNDAVHVLGTAATKPSVGIEALLDGRR